MIRLEANNRYVYIRGASTKVMRKLERVSSYKVAGYFFTPAFKAKRWDGREHLLRYHKGSTPGFRAPIGLLGDIMRCLDENGVAYELDESGRREPTEFIEVGWDPDVQLRPYQQEVVLTMAEIERWDTGLGIVKMPIRSGKTKTTAGLIYQLRVRTLFIVPSQMLLHQTRKALEETLQVPIGIIGDSEWEERDITVASIQTLSRARGGTREVEGKPLKKGEAPLVRFKGAGDLPRPYTSWEGGRCWMRFEGAPHADPMGVRPVLYNKAGKPVASLIVVKHRGKVWELKRPGTEQIRIPPDPRYKPMLTRYDMVVFDEVHHLKGEVWHKTTMDFDARYRVGLSATAYLDCERENGKGVIWLKACCGDIRVDISTSRLIEEGWLLRPTIMMKRVREPNLLGEKWSGKLHRDGIAMNEHRNQKIVGAALLMLRQGWRVLIVSNRVDQTAWLYDRLAAEVPVAAITGSTPREERERIVEAYTGDGLHVLVGTVFGEGVDIPVIECVINAEGGRDTKATIQRLRNLTPAEGKTRAVVIDFYDETNEYFVKHSEERLKAYQDEPAFRIRFVE